MKTTFTTAERAAFLAAHGNKCDNCNATGVKLQAHHSSYDSLPDMCLCLKCHRRLHVARRQPITRPNGMRTIGGVLISEADRITLRHQAADLRIGLPKYVGRILHTIATTGKFVATPHEKPGSVLPGLGQTSQLTLILDGLSRAQMETLLLEIVASVERLGGAVGGGFTQVDDNGNPTA